GRWVGLLLGLGCRRGRSGGRGGLAAGGARGVRPQRRIAQHLDASAGLLEAREVGGDALAGQVRGGAAGAAAGGAAERGGCAGARGGGGGGRGGGLLLGAAAGHLDSCRWWPG